MKPPLSKHPNAEISFYTGALTVLVVYAAGLAGLEPPPEVSSAFTVVITGLALLLGRRRP